MGTNPDPDKIRTLLYCKSAVIEPYSHGPQLSYLLEMQRGVRGVGFQQFEIFSGDRLNTFRQICKEIPETTAGVMHSQILEIPLGLFFSGFTHKEIEPSRLRVGFDFLIPPLPVLF